MLAKVFPFLRWFPLQRDKLRADVIAGITVAMILVPQSMAYASLAGLPVVYGLYASFLPVIVASLWGASRFLHTGPVAMLSLMSAAAIEPLATRGSEEFIQLSLLLALMVGVMRLLLGLFRMGVLINLASHPVILGFTNAAALIIGLSLVNSFLNVPMPRSDSFLADLWQVFGQMPAAHVPTLLFGVTTLLALYLLRKYYPKLPGVLILVILGLVVSVVSGFENTRTVKPEQVINSEARAAFVELVTSKTALAKVKQSQQAISNELVDDTLEGMRYYALQAELLRLQGEEESLRRNLYGLSIEAHKYALVPVQQDGEAVLYDTTGESGLFSPAWRWAGFENQQFVLSSGGSVVGNIPAGLPAFSVPMLDFGIISGLFATAFIMAMIGFMEATSISRALAAKTREKLDSNQELIGQGLANIVGSFFQSYVVSGSFSRSAVAAKAGAQTGMYAIISALGVLLVMLFLTEYLYHLPKAILAAIVMSAVFSLIDIKPMLHAWHVRRVDGVVGLVTFIATLVMAPKLANGVLAGVALTVLMYLLGSMKPRSEILGRMADGSLAGAISHDLAPVSENFVVLRFDSSLVFINAAYFEQAVLKALSEFPEASALLVIGNGINRIDATGEEKLRVLTQDLKAAGVTLMFAGLKKPVLEALERARLDEVIGRKNIFPSKWVALQVLEREFDQVKSLNVA
ncbi:MAG: SulP family inorganic anion transporter [Gammaproteobacteria bacterium]